jgi:hypothetical protein
VAEFLSDDWLRALDAALRASSALDALAPVVIEQVVNTVPGRGAVRYRVRIDETGARVDRLVGAAAAPADLRITTDYATAVAIANGSQNAQHALASGRLRLGGDVDVLVRRSEVLTTLADVTANVRSATTYPAP